MCDNCYNTNNWNFCPYCGHEIHKESSEDKAEMTQEKFDEIFLGMLRKANKVVWLNDAGTQSDIPTCSFDLRNADGEWMFYIRLQPAKPAFWFSFERVRMVFTKQYGLSYDEIQRLMKNQLKTLFNMDAVTPISSEPTKKRC